MSLSIIFSVSIASRCSLLDVFATVPLFHLMCVWLCLPVPTLCRHTGYKLEGHRGQLPDVQAKVMLLEQPVQP